MRARAHTHTHLITLNYTHKHALYTIYRERGCTMGGEISHKGVCELRGARGLVGEDGGGRGGCGWWRSERGHGEAWVLFTAEMEWWRRSRGGFALRLDISKGVLASCAGLCTAEVISAKENMGLWPGVAWKGCQGDGDGVLGALRGLWREAGHRGYARLHSWESLRGLAWTGLGWCVLPLWVGRVRIYRDTKGARESTCERVSRGREREEQCVR